MIDWKNGLCYNMTMNEEGGKQMIIEGIRGVIRDNMAFILLFIISFIILITITFKYELLIK